MTYQNGLLNSVLKNLNFRIVYVCAGHLLGHLLESVLKNLQNNHLTLKEFILMVFRF